MNARKLIALAFLSSLIIVSCSSPRSAGPPGVVLPTMPKSVSPGSIPAAPMAKTTILPASVMDVRPQSAIQGTNWSQVPGSATEAAVAPDGSLWVLSDSRSGPNKFIWHYASGAWTNISGLAAHLAVGTDGTLYAINGGGGIYSYANGAWTALGGGADSIAVGRDGVVYVASNGGPGPDRGIWRFTSKIWTQLPGSGVKVAASWDTSNYSGPFPGGSGTIIAGGIFIINSSGQIYYENPDGTFALIPGNASELVPLLNGGLFVLSFPSDANGNAIYYYDLNNPGWSLQSGSAVSIATDGSTLYAISSSGAIYKTPVSLVLPSASPSPSPSPSSSPGSLPQFDPQTLTLTMQQPVSYADGSDCHYDGTLSSELTITITGTGPASSGLPPLGHAELAGNFFGTAHDGSLPSCPHSASINFDKTSDFNGGSALNWSIGVQRQAGSYPSFQLVLVFQDSNQNSFQHLSEALWYDSANSWSFQQCPGTGGGGLVCGP